MYYQIISYIRFIFTATNQHGVHSPFVYKFVTQCLYCKSSYKGSKTNKILFKSIAYFKANSVHAPKGNKHLKSIISNEFPKIDFNLKPFDIIYQDKPDPIAFQKSINDKGCHNNTMVLIKDIHRNKSNSTIWEQFKDNQSVTVSIDMYHCGALFFRKEQVKEHFKIRI